MRFIQYDSDSKQIVNFFKGLLLPHHLFIYRIDMFRSAFNFKMKPPLIQFILNRLHELIDEYFT
jgi:hypothetical protein